MNKPVIIEQYADNGEFSHWQLVKVETGEVLWSSYPEETEAQGQKIISSNLPVMRSHGDNCRELHSACDDCAKKFYQWLESDKP